MRRARNQGFTLIELLVTLFLVATLFFFALNVDHSSRDKLEGILDRIESSLRFTVNEAILRNAIVRMNFNLELEKSSYAVEYSNSSAFVLPEFDKLLSQEKGSLKEQKKVNKLKDKIDQKFNKVNEMESDESKEITKPFRIIGVGTSVTDKLVTEGNISIYVYPTGERDSGIIIIGNDQEVVGLSIEPFTGEFKREYVKIKSDEIKDGKKDLVEIQEGIAEELFRNWKQ
ncbi:MAG: prepilin-type N-terminal cleavage/methylation domain-containing protein [Bacteriovoracaceae bacterium]